MLSFHVAAGTIALVAGAGALLFRKGSQPHRAAGILFVISMLGMAASGAVLALLTREWISVLGGITTTYFVVTAWWTLRRAGRGKGRFEAAMLALAVAGGLGYVAVELEAARSGIRPAGVPAGVGYVFGAIVFLAALGDARMLRRGSISRNQRIARHLWRMCYALLIASISFFLGQMQVFPAFVRDSGILFVLAFLPLAAMAFWVPRTLWRKRSSGVGSQPAVPGARPQRPSPVHADGTGVDAGNARSRRPAPSP